MIALDTDVLIEIFDRNSNQGEEALSNLEGHEIGTTSINLHEIGFGLMKAGQSVPSELTSLRVLDLTEDDALLSSKMEADLEGQGNSPCRFDAMIASICVNNGAWLYNLNLAHFRRFHDHGLRVFRP